MSLTDLDIAVSTAVVVILIFLVASWVQRRQPAAPAPAPAEAITGELSPALDSRLKAIEVQQKVTDERSKSTEHDVRNIRAVLPALPSKDAVHRLEVDLTKLAGRLETVDQGMLAMSRAVDRIENHLLGGAKGHL